MDLTLLPLEILTEILLHLEVPDAYALRATNHFFHVLYQTSTQLQYATECKVAQVWSNLFCHIPLEERLLMLRERESAWRSLKPTSKRMLYCRKHLGRYLHSVTRGHYISAGFTSKDLPAVLQSVAIQEHDPHCFRTFPVSNVLHFFCCIDEHDLVAYVNGTHDRTKLQIHLLQHSTGNVHPLAVKPIISLNVEPVWSLQGEIFGENLVFTLYAPGLSSYMYIYDWKMGEAKCEPIPVSTNGVIVLDSDLVLVPNNEDWSLNIYYIPPSAIGGPVKLVQTLGLPPLFGVDAEWVRCHSLPNPTGDGRFPKHISPSIPFIDDPQMALMHFVWELGEYEVTTYVSMVVHRSSIIKTLGPSAKDWSAVTEASTIEWDSWGPPVTHWRTVSANACLYSTCPTYGQRRILPSFSTNVGAIIENFNIYNVRQEASGTGYNVYDFPVFEKPVKCGLPFAGRYLDLPQSDLQRLISDGVVIRVEECDDDTASLEVLHFGNLNGSISESMTEIQM